MSKEYSVTRCGVAQCAFGYEFQQSKVEFRNLRDGRLEVIMSTSKLKQGGKRYFNTLEMQTLSPEQRKELAEYLKA